MSPCAPPKCHSPELTILLSLAKFFRLTLARSCWTFGLCIFHFFLQRWVVVLPVASRTDFEITDMSPESPAAESLDKALQVKNPDNHDSKQPQRHHSDDEFN